MAEEEGQRASERAHTAPDPDDPRKPDQLSEVSKPSWLYVLRKAAREFSTDQATDLAAALTYRGVRRAPMRRMSREVASCAGRPPTRPPLNRACSATRPT